ncbi:MAG: hypothetical protein QM811_21670 [Pirellulales bacterium]
MRVSRADEERLTSDAILGLFADAASVAVTPPLEFFRDENPITRRSVASPERRAVFLGERPYLCEMAGRPTVLPARFALFPGSFNPMHVGHRGMATVASARLGLPVINELSIANVDKPPLDYLEIVDRTSQFAVDEAYVLTAAPTFAEKAKLFPGTTFVVGVDTILRIAPPKYYGTDPDGGRRAIAAIAEQCCRFLVFGRTLPDRSFQTLSDCELPAELRAICDEVPESAFRADVSSTELRRGEQADHR